MISTFSINEQKNLPIYMVCSGIGAQGACQRAAGCKSIPQITLCIEGEGIFVDENGEEHKIQKGDVFIFRSGISHSYSPVTDIWSVLWINFSGYGVNKIMDYAGFHDTDIIHLQDIELYEKLYTQLYHAHQICWRDGLCRHFTTSPILYSTLLNLGRLLNQDATEGSTDSRKEQLAPVIRTIFIRFQDDLSTAFLADKIGVSTVQLNRLFKEVYHISPMKYLRNVRIHFAKNELCRNKNASVDEIAKLSGFGDTSYFCKVFKEMFNETPKHYQNTHSVEDFIWDSNHTE